ncbi:MAG: LysR family transcriptional regulator [Casimicrobiaceae bacterium]
MDLNQLRSFIAVAKHGHLTRAAESIHLSQPALSAQIKALEEGLGVSLFRRSPSGMSLTPSGRVLREEAERILQAVSQLQQAAANLRGVTTGKLSLGTVLDPATVRVGELLALAMDRYPQVEIELHQAVSHEALLWVRNGSLDASFYFGPQPEGVEAVRLRDIHYVLAMPVGWQEELPEMSWPTLAERPWVVAPSTSSHRHVVLEAFRGHAALPERLIEADSESVIVNLVEAGVGASLVRRELAEHSAADGRIALFPDVDVVTQLWLLYDPARQDDALIEALTDTLRAVWSAPIPTPASTRSRETEARAAA